MATFTEVGAYEAKTHLSDFLRKVKAGAVIRITQRGEHVADLVPPDTKGKRDALKAAIRMGVIHAQSRTDCQRQHQGVD